MKKIKFAKLVLCGLAFLTILINGCTKEEIIQTNENTPVHLKSTATNCDWTFHYVDNFNNAVNSSDYGLNSNLAARQLYGQWKNTTWTRKSGAWYNKTTQPWCVQVNHPYLPNVLSFHLEYSAVLLNKLISAGTPNKYRVSFKTNPSTTEQTSNYWTSFMLDASSTKRGYVTQTNFGFLIGSNGSVQVFQNGNSQTVTGIVPAAAEYQVVLVITPGSLQMTINGTQLTAVLNETVPSNSYAYLGAYIDPANPVVSSFDDLVINTQFSTAAKRVQHYGYYWADRAYGTHFSEITDYTNFNFVEFIDATTPNTKTNVLQLRWQFWADATGNLRPDWETQWIATLATINQNIGKIKALYLFDEPFWAVQCSVSDYNMVLNRVKADCPTLPIIAVFAYPTVNDLADTRIQNSSSVIDWVGADRYVSVSNFSLVNTMNTILKIKRPNNNIFLIPQTHFEGTTTDAQVAEINWLFYSQALNDTRVIGLWNFGLWCFTIPAQVPITLEAQKLIGKAITTY
jgi:hypothetical protein